MSTKRAPNQAHEFHEGAYLMGLAHFSGLRARLTKAGIIVPANCRFVEYERVLSDNGIGDRIRNGGSITSSDWHAIIEMRQFDLVCSALLSQADAIDLIRRAFFADPAVTDPKAQHGKGRSLQFELYIAARFKSVGYPVRFEEPDICASIDGWQISIAAKKMRSVAKLKQRIKDASGQIVRSRRPGLVALDLTLLDSNYGQVVKIPRGIEPRELYLNNMGRLFDDHFSDMRQAVDPKFVFGVIAFTAGVFFWEEFDRVAPFDGLWPRGLFDGDSRRESLIRIARKLHGSGQTTSNPSARVMVHPIAQTGVFWRTGP